MSLIVAGIIGISGGAFIGLAWERLRGRDPLTPKPHAITDAQLAKMHVIKDEWFRPDVYIRGERRDGE